MNIWDQYLAQLMGMTGSAQSGIMQPLQTGASDLFSYLGLGQKATQNAQDAAKLQLLQNQQRQSGLGSLFGGLVSPLLFGAGGIGSLFGGQGLLGGLLGADGGGDWSSGYGYGG